MQFCMSATVIALWSGYSKNKILDERTSFPHLSRLPHNLQEYFSSQNDFKIHVYFSMKYENLPPTNYNT